MKKHLPYIIFILFSGLFCIGQTSMHTEITQIDLPKDYILKNGIAKEIIVTKKINPGQDFSYSDKTVYTFTGKSIIHTTYFKDSELESTRDFSIDSLNRIVKNTIRFKFKTLGWTISKYETVYKEKMKDLKILNNDGSLNYTMRVIFNENNDPIEIKTLDANNKLISLATAKYDYKNNNFIYTVYREDGSIVLNKTEAFKKDYEIKRNEFGDLSEFYWPISKSGIKYILEYKYDKLGNWIKIKKIQIDGENKKVTEIINRKIQYLKN